MELTQPPPENATSHAEPVQYALGDAADLQDIGELLASNGLPSTDIAQHLQHFVVAKLRGEIVAVAGIEVHAPHALLRSVCVRAVQRGRGLAMRACELLEAHARNLGVTRWYLLTTTAREYFEQRGFEVCSRAAAPEAIRATAEFRALCPATAICMTRPLGAGALHLPAALLPLRPDVPGARWWAVTLEDTMLTYFEVEPHTCFPAHSHPGEQITTVAEGELFFELADRTVAVTVGEVIAIPPGVVHAVFTRKRAARAFDAWSPPPRTYRTCAES